MPSVSSAKATVVGGGNTHYQDRERRVQKMKENRTPKQA